MKNLVVLAAIAGIGAFLFGVGWSIFVYRVPPATPITFVGQPSAAPPPTSTAAPPPSPVSQPSAEPAPSTTTYQPVQVAPTSLLDVARSMCVGGCSDGAFDVRNGAPHWMTHVSTWQQCPEWRIPSGYAVDVWDGQNFSPKVAGPSDLPHVCEATVYQAG